MKNTPLLSPSALLSRLPFRSGRARLSLVSLGAIAASLLTLPGATTSDVALVEVGLTTVESSSFHRKVTRDGIVEPFKTAAVHSESYWSAPILSILPEGTWVQEGDIVCVLDSADIEDYARKREVTLVKYRGRLESAVQDEQLVKASNERRLSAAKFSYQKFADRLSEYEQATYPQQIEDLEDQLSILASESESSDEALRHTEKLWTMGLVGIGEMEKYNLAHLKNTEALRKAESSYRLLTEFTHPRSETKLRHDRTDAALDITRTQLVNSRALTSARTTTLSYERRLHIYERIYRRAMQSIEACTMRAPCDGPILYGNSWYLMSRGITQIAEGKTVRRFQKVFEIPDTARLRVNVPLDEAMIHKVEQDMAVTVTVPGFEESAIAGRISEIARYPRVRSRYTPGVKDYWLGIELMPTEDQQAFLKAKSDATVEFRFDEIPDAIQIPRASVTGVAGRNFVYVFDGRELIPRQVELGDASDENVCVISGLNVGEQLVTVMTEQHEAKLLKTLQDSLLDEPPARCVR